MIVLSLFDGMSCGYEALKRAGIYVEKYYASEIDKYAMKIAKKNHPDIIHLGDVTNWQEWDIEKPDLIIGGSPCQGFSFAGDQLAFDDPRSKLFFEMTDIIDYYKPRFKLLENVKMKKESLEIITDFMDCGEPHFINSALVSAQNRQRYYWYNWDAPDPVDRGLLLKDIIISDGDGYIKSYGEFKLRPDKAMCIDSDYHTGADNHGQRTLIRVGSASNIKGHDCIKRIYSISGIGPTLMGGAGGNSEPKVAVDEIHYRKLTPIECERLQTLSDNYTEGVSNTRRYMMIGNGWTVEVIAHLFSYMPINDLQRLMQ